MGADAERETIFIAMTSTRQFGQQQEQLASNYLTAQGLQLIKKNYQCKVGEIDLIINTPLGQRSRRDEYAIGRTAVKYKIPFITTLSAAEAVVRGLRTKINKPINVKCLQDYYKE